MRKPPLWFWPILAFVVADLLLAVTGTGVLMRQQRAHGWMAVGDTLDFKKRPVPMLACTYWVGWRTRTVAVTTPGQGCPRINR